MSMSTRLGVGRLAVEKLASPQQAPGRLHVETWAGLLQKQGLRISQQVEIAPGCAAVVDRPSCLDNSPVSPGRGRVIRNMLGWSQLERTAGSGVWLFRDALERKNLLSSLDAVGDWFKTGSYPTAWAVPVIPRALVRVRTGEALLYGHTLESGAGHCSLVCGGLSHP